LGRGFQERAEESSPKQSFIGINKYQVGKVEVASVVTWFRCNFPLKVVLLRKK
jgi:hypothetical protein